MAFMRTYRERSAMGRVYAGDPGFGKWFKRAFKPPKAIRKLQPGKLLGKAVKAVAPIAAGVFTGGLGAVAAGLGSKLFGGGRPMETPAPVEEYIPPVVMPPPAPVYTVTVPEEEIEEEEDMYAMQTGAAQLAQYQRLQQLLALLGWSGDPGSSRIRRPKKVAAVKPQKKRKIAAAGPKAKAAAKKKNRGLELLAGGLSAGGRAVGAALPGLLEAFGRGGPKGAMAHMALPGLGATMPGMIPAIPGVRGFGRKRRSMNPANVKALRRGLRRVEGFEKLVTKVHKLYPRLARASAGGRARRAGHRAGCKCVGCR